MVCTLRIGLAVMGSPKDALVIAVFQLGKVTWFSALITSKRRSNQFQERPREALSEGCTGPVSEFLPALPHAPFAGGRKAATFKKRPCVGA